MGIIRNKPVGSSFLCDWWGLTQQFTLCVRNTLRTLRTLQFLLNANNPRKVLLTLILFLEKVRRAMGGRSIFYTKPGSDALTLPIKNENTACNRCLEDDLHWPPRPEKR